MKKILNHFAYSIGCIVAIVTLSHAGIISSYSIQSAVTSGFGGWQHTFDGEIIETGTVSFMDITGVTADYINGTGTLNDGIIGSTDQTTQLFFNQGAVSPVITLNLDNYYLIENLALLNSEMFYSNIVGKVSSVDVTINGFSETFSTTSEMGPKSEFVNLAGSAYVLSAQPSNQITLSGFVTEAGQLENFFAFSEIVVSATAASVPEASMIPLLAVGLLGLLVISLQQKRRLIHSRHVSL